MKQMKAVLAMGLAVGCLMESDACANWQGFFYRFDNVTTQSGTIDPSPVPYRQDIVFGSFQAVGYGANPAAAGSFTWTSNELGGIDKDDNFDDFTGHLNEGKYFEVTFGPRPGGTIDVEEMHFLVRRSLTGARSYAVRSSLDGFTSNLPADIYLTNTNLGVSADNSFKWLYDATPSKFQAGSDILLGSEFHGLIQPVTFRIYAWNAESSSGTFSIDDFCIFFPLNPMPEPSPAVLLGLGLIAVAIRRQAALTFAPASRSRGCSDPT